MQESSSTNSMCSIKACVGLNCSQMVFNHTDKVESLSLYIPRLQSKKINQRPQ